MLELAGTEGLLARRGALDDIGETCASGEAAVVFETLAVG
jgi:hypothetical protein